MIVDIFAWIIVAALLALLTIAGLVGKPKC